MYNYAKVNFTVLVRNCILGFAHFLTSTCFAELGSRIPKTGSAYIYAYAVLGELVAFVVGWSLLLEHIMAASMAAKGMNYLPFTQVETLTNEKTLKV